MGGHVLIVDRDQSRRRALRSALGLAGGEGHDLGDPADLPDRVAAQRPDMLLIDLEPEEPALDALRRIRARPGAPLPVIALVPPGRADLRLAGLRAGAEEATCRDTAARILQARVRSLLRTRETALEAELPEEGGFALSGLAEAPAPFLSAVPAGLDATDRTRVGLLGHARPGSRGLAEALERHLGAEMTSLPASSSPARPEGPDLDLVVIDATSIQGDLAQGAQVLAQLADLRGRPRTRDAATLVLLPASAVETAALALDLGAWDVVSGPASPEEIALRARALSSRRRQAEVMRDQVRQGLRAALTDPLTGLPNRRHAEAALRRLAERSRLSGRGFAVMMLDIDHFKAINDRHGHPAGDRVLAEVARRLKSGMRPADLLARVGGEEFLLALPDTTAGEAGAIAERLRRAIRARPFAVGPRSRADDALHPWLDAREPAFVSLPRSWPEAPDPAGPGGPAQEVRVTVSIGVAVASGGACLGLRDLLKRADDALYEAKRAGRDAVATAPEAA